MKAIIENEKYHIYEEYDDTGNKYYLTVPKSNALEYQIYCSLNEGYFPDKEVIDKVCHIFESISKNNNQIVYLHIILNNGELTEAAKDNDNHLYKILLKEVLSTIRHAYQVIIQAKIVGINNKITFISQNKDDTKFIDWLEIMGIIPIDRISLNNYQEFLLNDTSDGNSGASLAGGDIESELTEDKPMVRKKTPPKHSSGFGNIVLIIITLIVALAIGIGVAYILIK